jgi:hypothetical protein
MRQAETVKKAEKAREHWTLCRAAREYHERAIETTKTTKHAADWINSLENHLPASIWHKPIDAIDAPELLQALAGVTAHARARRVEQGARVMETLQRIRQRVTGYTSSLLLHLILDLPLRTINFRSGKLNIKRIYEMDFLGVQNERATDQGSGPWFSNFALTFASSA